jgi:hypothetical protein
MAAKARVYAAKALSKVPIKYRPEKAPWAQHEHMAGTIRKTLENQGD